MKQEQVSEHGVTNPTDGDSASRVLGFQLLDLTITLRGQCVNVCDGASVGTCVGQW